MGLPEEVVVVEEGVEARLHRPPRELVAEERKVVGAVAKTAPLLDQVAED